MPEKRDERLTNWQLRWDRRINWLRDVVSCLRGEPRESAVRRILRLPWYSRENGFQFLSFSPKQKTYILDLRGIPLRKVNLANISIPFALLEGADFYKSNLENADLSFVRAVGASFHQAKLNGTNLTAARLDGCDISMASLNGAELSRAHLTNADLGWSELRGARLKSTHLEGANLERVKSQLADFTDANLHEANLSMADSAESKFDGARLIRAKLVGANLERTNFAYADLSGADLSLAYLQDSYFISAKLNNAELTRAHLEKADLTNADFTDANLSAVHLEGAGLRGAKLRRAIFIGANLEKTYLREADLREADLTQTSLLEANLEAANLTGANLTECHFRSARYSATVDDETTFGLAGHGVDAAVVHPGYSQWLYPPLSSHDKESRDEVEPSEKKKLASQVRMLFRDNGFFGKAATFFEQENYWRTRELKDEQKWLPYVFRLIFFEIFMGYGERPRRVILAGLLIMLFFGLLYPMTGMAMGGRLINYDIFGGIDSFSLLIYDIWIGLMFSVQCFTTMGFWVVKPASTLTFSLASFEAISGFFMIALWIVVFVRKAIRE